MSLVELVYTSRASRRFTEAALEALLAHARSNNGHREISGVLLYHDGTFLQILEGPPAAVEALFERVTRDPRHAEVVVLRRREIEERRFAQWAMGFVADEARARRLSVPEGFVDFLRTGRLDHWRDEAPSEDRRLLDAFRSGRFRRA